MLSNLRISNFAIIDDMEIDFSSGLSVLLGETGAGKSIIVEALSLLKGTKSTFSKIRDESKNAIIEGTFVFTDEVFKRHPELLEYKDGESPEIVISRIMTPLKTTKVRLNGIQVSLGELKEIMADIIDIHSQGENYALFNQDKHIDFLDSYDPSGDIARSKTTYEASYASYKSLMDELEALRDSVNGEDREYLEYQIGEIERYNLKPNEIEDIEQELSDMEEYDDLKSDLESFNEVYEGQEYGFQYSFQELVSRLRALSRGPLGDKANASIEKADEFIESISDLLSDYDRLDFDPVKIERYNARLFELKELQHKYGNKTSDILEALEGLKTKLSNIDSFELDEETLAKRIKGALEDLEGKARELSRLRAKAASELSKAIDDELGDLGLLSGGFKVELSTSELTRNGKDKATFMLALNKGSRFLPLKEAASGGENSRLMLALKTVFNSLSPYDVIVFDEIDTGISGHIATKVGKKIREIAKSSQTIVITHLAQVAGLGEHHYLVSKGLVNDSTVSSIELITGEKVVNELAKMVSGEEVTSEALEVARSFLKG